LVFQTSTMKNLWEIGKALGFPMTLRIFSATYLVSENSQSKFFRRKKKSYEEKIFIAFLGQDYAKSYVGASEYQPCATDIRLISPRTTKHESGQSRLCALSTGVSEKSCTPTENEKFSSVSYNLRHFAWLKKRKSNQNPLEWLPTVFSSTSRSKQAASPTSFRERTS
jgi:hypothetical protein